MPSIIDPQYLRSQQYKDANRLQARIQLHQRFSTNHYGWFKWVFEQFDLPADAKILELGCGPGTLWLENKDRIPHRWFVTLSDFSRGMIKDAKTNLRGVSFSFTCAVSNALALPFPQQTFDAIVANHMLYHVPDLQICFSEINRVLKPNGRFFATTNGDNHLLELDELMDKYFNFKGNRYTTAFSGGSFTLNNGASQLSPWFTQVNIHYYEDSLRVTESTPLLAYLLSMIPENDLPGDKSFIKDLVSSLDQQIKQNGSINIQKSIGMFVCNK